MFDLCFLHCVCPWILLASTVKPLSLPPSLYKPICLNLPLRLLSPFACLCPTSFSYYYKHIFIDIFTGASNGFYWRRQRWNFTCQREGGGGRGRGGKQDIFFRQPNWFSFSLSCVFQTSRMRLSCQLNDCVLFALLLQFYTRTTTTDTHTHSRAHTHSQAHSCTPTHTQRLCGASFVSVFPDLTGD